MLYYEYPSISMHFLKVEKKNFGSERVPFWQICLKSILMHMVCVHAHMKTHLETLKATDEVCGYSSVKNSCLLHNLKTGKISNQPEALPKKDNLYLG